MYNMDYKESNEKAPRKHEGTTLQNTHKVHQDIAVKTCERKTVVGFFRGDKEHNLFLRYDSKGKYYEITAGKTEKLYLEGDDAKPDYKLRSLKDFPMWSMLLSIFYDQFNMDDITNTNLDFSKIPTQCKILGEVIGDSLAKKYRDYLRMRLDGQTLYKKIRHEVTESYNQWVKDNVWKEIVVGTYCSDVRRPSTTCSDMISLETYSEDEDAGKLTNGAISRKVRNTLSPDLRMQIGSKYEPKYGADL